MSNKEIQQLQKEIINLTTEKDRYKSLLETIYEVAQARKSERTSEDIFMKNLCNQLGYAPIMDSVARLWIQDYGISGVTMGVSLGVLEQTLFGEIRS